MIREGAEMAHDAERNARMVQAFERMNEDQMYVDWHKDHDAMYVAFATGLLKAIMLMFALGLAMLGVLLAMEMATDLNPTSDVYAPGFEMTKERVRD